MRVAIETSTAKITNAGISRYTRGLMSGFDQLEKHRLSYREVSYRPKFGRGNKILRAVDTLCREIVWLQYGLGRECRKHSVDLLHVTNPMMPIKPECPTVVTVHDLHPLQHPENSTSWARFSFKHYLELSLVRADAIIAVSSYSGDELRRRYPDVDPAKIHVVLEGVEDKFCRLAASDISAVRDKYGLSHPFVFSLFNWAENKNIERLMEAFSLASKGSGFHLVMAGGMNGREKDAELLASRFGISDRVFFLGYVPDDDLPALYNAADIFCFPSLYEGFGLPPLEAMACGTPVVASNVTSMPEVLGDGAVLVAPFDSKEIAGGLRKLMYDKDLSSKCVDAGEKRAAELTWKQCAQKTLEVYEKTLVLNASA